MAHLLKQVEGLAKGDGVSFCLTSPFPSAFHLEGINFVGALWSADGHWCPRFAGKGSGCCSVLCTPSLGGLVSGAKGMYSRNAPFCSVSSWDQCCRLCPSPPACPFPPLRKKAASSSEHSWAQKNARAAAQVLEAGGGTKQQWTESKGAEPKPSPSQSQRSWVKRSRVNGTWSQTSLEEDNTVESNQRNGAVQKQDTWMCGWSSFLGVCPSLSLIDSSLEKGNANYAEHPLSCVCPSSGTELSWGGGEHLFCVKHFLLRILLLLVLLLSLCFLFHLLSLTCYLNS